MKPWIRVWLDFSALIVSEPQPKPTRSVAFFLVLTLFCASSPRDCAAISCNKADW